MKYYISSSLSPYIFYGAHLVVYIWMLSHTTSPTYIVNIFAYFYAVYISGEYFTWSHRGQHYFINYTCSRIKILLSYVTVIHLHRQLNSEIIVFYHGDLVVFFFRLLHMIFFLGGGGGVGWGWG